MTDVHDKDMRILAPIEAKPRLASLRRDYIHDAVRDPERFGITRRQLLALGGTAAFVAFAAACGTTTTGGGSATSATPTVANTLAGKPIEGQLQIYNWSQYDAPSTYKKFENLPAEKAAGLNIHETYYSSNDELLAKLNAGAGGYDIIVPSQNAVAQLIDEGKLMVIDASLIPNLKNLDPKFLKVSYDPTGEYHVIKDYGITMFFYNNKIVTEQPATMKDFYDLLNKYASKGRTNILDGAEEVVPLALMALGLDPNTDSQSDFDQVKQFLLSVRKGVTTISSFNYINDGIAGKIVLGQGWNGDVRRIVQGRKAQGDITAVIPHGASEVWADNWCIPADAPHPVAAHAWINWLLQPSTAVSEMNYHNYAIPIPDALAQVPASLQNDPLFNVPASYTDNYKYILNVSPQVVQARTNIYTAFKAA
jgi:spermidine/putrescine transport system substrate-binding protein